MDYEKYQLSKKDWIWLLSLYISFVLILSYLFYDDLKFSLIGIIGIYPYLFWMKKRKISQRRSILKQEFQECLGVVSTFLVSGYSPEKSFIAAKDQINHLQGKDSLMSKELDRIRYGLESGISLEKLLEDFGKRSHEKDIQIFVKIFSIGRRLGGNLNQILISTILQIQGKIKIQEEIKTTIAQKNLERKIMNFIPIFMLAYVRFFTGDILKGIYHQGLGYIFMSVALVIYGFCVIWGHSITKIEI